MAKPVKIPKRVAGVKVPKAIRKGAIGKFVGSPAGQMLIAEILVVVAGVLAAKRTDPDSRTGELLRHPVEGLRDATDAVAARSEGSPKRIAASSEKLTFALGEALNAFRTALQEDPAAGATRGEKHAAKKKSSELFTDVAPPPH